jgi:cellobiose phosphorylase
LWREHLSASRVASQLPAFDNLQNTWLPYQALSARLWGRTGYYQQSGAFGFRDQLQDSQVWLPINPRRCADQITLHASRMFEDGSVNHWWHALADFGNRTACSDDYLWLAFVTSSYLRETADYAFLDRPAPYQRSAKTGPLREHCLKAIDRAFDRLSPRGLPLIGSCDWNDGLSALGLEERGESVWLAMFLASILADWALIASHTNDARLAARCAQRRESLLNAIGTHAWDSAGYFKCATKDNGEWIGASDCAQGAIHLNPQTWSILANAAPPDRQRLAWDAVKKNLLTPYGPLLLAPAYSTPDPDIGYITRYSPGSRENGGVYMHAATWALAAACAMRDRDAASAIWKSIAPPLRANDAEAYAAEPYVLPGNVDGPLSDTPGRAGWTWYTGSAAWLQRVCMEWVLGVRPVYTTDSPAGGLLIDPVPAEHLGTVRFERTWRGRRLRIAFDARDFHASRPARVLADGQPLPNNTLRPEHLAHRNDATAPVDIRVLWKDEDR